MSDPLKDRALTSCFQDNASGLRSSRVAERLWYYVTAIVDGILSRGGTEGYHTPIAPLNWGLNLYVQERVKGVCPVA